MTLTPELLRQIYRTMVKIRKFEERIHQEYCIGNVCGMLHLSVGQEAVPAGACAALRKEDFVTSNHRGHGHCIAKGGDIRLMAAEILGKETGYCRGKGGSMHIADPALGIIGANGIVGAGLTIATGCGLSSLMRGSGQVAVCFFSDGASNQGTFHESLNMAAIWKLPVLYICENNLYAVTTRQTRAQAIKDIAVRASGYGMPGEVVDGNDAACVYEAVSSAVARARAGEGPTLLEAKTYRHFPHCETEPPNILYRSLEEQASWKERDPILLLSRRLLQEGLASAEELAEVEAGTLRDIEQAIVFAKESPEPALSAVWEGVYSHA
jgi:acetoin:2,6-dichlorophenolindophenol oxidoreductase subunit alpha